MVFYFSFFVCLGQKSYIIDDNFPEGSIEDAGNYCRSPDYQGYEPYCFTTNPEEAWEYCGVKKCDGRIDVHLLVW